VQPVDPGSELNWRVAQCRKVAFEFVKPKDSASPIVGVPPDTQLATVIPKRGECLLGRLPERRWSTSVCTHVVVANVVSEQPDGLRSLWEREAGLLGDAQNYHRILA
jgi:hypothetical protein